MENFKLSPKTVVPIVVVALIIIVGVGGLFYFNSKSNKSNPNNSQQTAQNVEEEVKKLVLEVSKVMELPVGETPTVATVTDISKLKDQPFFQKAKNGDKVLIYSSSKKAILYDPISKKVLDISPINLGSQSAQQVSAKIVLKNGTGTTGLTTKIEQELKKSNPQVSIILKENAAKQDYEKTVVVVLNSSFEDAAAGLATVLKAQVGDLPAGESNPKDGDILIILGKDAT